MAGSLPEPEAKGLANLGEDNSGGHLVILLFETVPDLLQGGLVSRNAGHNRLYAFDLQIAKG